MMEDVGTSANQLVQLDSNAKIPAVDGSLLTGLGGLSGSSDPTISTNPGTVGTKFINTTDGEIFICTDATAGANVWTNVGAGSGDVAPYPNSHKPGTTYGYHCGGYYPSSKTNIIERFSFTSDGNGVDVGDLISVCNGGAGSDATAYGYHSGTNTPPGYTNTIEKFQMVASANSTDIGNLTVARGYATASQSTTYGYCAGGQTNGTSTNVIDKHAFANSNNATDVGDLPSTNDRNTGSSSTTYGYSHGGVPVVTVVSSSKRSTPSPSSKANPSCIMPPAIASIWRVAPP